MGKILLNWCIPQDSIEHSEASEEVRGAPDMGPDLGQTSYFPQSANQKRSLKG